MTFKSSLNRLLIGFSFLVSTSAFASPITVGFTNIESNGFIGDPQNYVQYVDVGSNSTITGISYSVDLTAFEPSWLADRVFAFERSDFLAGVFFTPGFETAAPGTGSYSGSASLVDLGLDFQVGEDGLLRLEFFEAFDDVPGVDGIWNFASFTFEVEPGPSPVPEPASALLLAAGLAAMRRASIRRSLNKAGAKAIH